MTELTAMLRILLRNRSYLRRLSRTQRRSWAEQRARLEPRVRISSAWVPHRVSSAFTYIEVGGAR